MPKPNFSTLKDNHYSSSLGSPSYQDGAYVYKEIGYDINALMKENGAYWHTCAVRLSLALLKAGVHFDTPHSRLVIKEGEYKGRFVGTGAKTLADVLSQPLSLGKPMTGDRAVKAAQAQNAKGVIFFHKIPGYGGGHIDLIEYGKCNSGCYFDDHPKEIWFWPLN